MKSALLTVSSGFKLVYIGLMLVVLAVVIGILGSIVIVGGAFAGAKAGNAPAVVGAFNSLRVLLVAVAVLAAAGKITGLIGRFKCMAIPQEAGGARQMIVLSVALELVSLGISILQVLDMVGGEFLNDSIRTGVNAGGMICSIIAAILFLLFTRTAAEFIRRRDLADTAMSVLWLWVACFLCYLAGAVLVLGLDSPAGGIAMIAALILGLVALSRYAGLLTAMSEATRKYSRSASYDFDDEEDEDDRPRRKRRRRSDDDDEEEDEDDRPRRKRRRRDDDDDDDWDR